MLDCISPHRLVPGLYWALAWLNAEGKPTQTCSLPKPAVARACMHACGLHTSNVTSCVSVWTQSKLTQNQSPLEIKHSSNFEPFFPPVYWILLSLNSPVAFVFKPSVPGQETRSLASEQHSSRSCSLSRKVRWYTQTGKWRGTLTPDDLWVSLTG